MEDNEKKKDLNDRKRALLSKVGEVLQDHMGKENMIHAPKLAMIVGTNERSLRKIIHHIRTWHLLPVISLASGYYVSYKHEDLDHQIAFFNRVAYENMDLAYGLEYFLKHKPTENLKIVL